MEVFATVDVRLTREECITMTGLPTRDIVEMCYAQKPWTTKTRENVADEIIDSVGRMIADNAVPMEGAMEALEFFRTRNIPLALASSSPMRLINAVLEKFKIREIFSVVHSAENEPFGKPHPAVFLTTAQEIHVEPVQCLVIEDSFNGLIAAKAARMKSIVLPIPAQWNENRFDIADLKIRSLTELTEVVWRSLNLEK